MKRLSTFRDFVGELQVTYKRTSQPTAHVRCSKDAVDFIRPYFEDVMDDHECAKVIHLNYANGIVNVHEVTSGDVTGTLIPIDRILQSALLIKTKAIVLVHNHPSGQLKSSVKDREVSKKLKQACKLVDIQLLDSLIITREGYYSLADQQELK